MTRPTPDQYTIDSHRRRSAAEGGNVLVLSMDRSWLVATFHIVFQYVLLGGSIGLLGQPAQRGEVFVLMLMALLVYLMRGIDTAIEKTLDLVEPNYNFDVNAIKTLTDFLCSMTARGAYCISMLFMMMPDPNWKTAALVTAYFGAFPLMTWVFDWRRHRV